MAAAALAACSAGGSDDESQASQPTDAAAAVETNGPTDAQVPEDDGEPATEEADDTLDVAPSSGPRRGGRLVVVTGTDPMPLEGFDPTDDACAWACRNVLDGVLETLTVVTPDGTVEPWLAERVTPDVSLTRWTVVLRDGIRFSDGEPLDARTVKTAFDDIVKSGDVSGPYVREARVLSVNVTDGLTLTYSLSEPNGGFPRALAGPMGRAFSVAEAARRQVDLTGLPIGTGPFVFSDATQLPDVIELVANDDYWRDGADGQPLPYVDEVVFSTEADAAARLASVREGTAHVISAREAAVVAEVAPGGPASVPASQPTADDLTVVANVEDNAGAVIFNTFRAPLNDVRVRRGLAYALDTAALAALTGADALGGVATQWWAPSSVWHSSDAAERWPRDDPAHARNLLSEYVNDASRSDARRRGTNIAFTLLCTDHPALAPLAAALEAQWEATGLVDVDVELVSRTALIGRVTGSVRDQPSFAGQFDAACWRLGGERDPWVMFDEAFGARTTSPLNVTNLADDALSAAITRLGATSDEAERERAADEITDALTTLVPNVYLTYATSAIIGNPGVGGVGATTLPNGDVVTGQHGGVGRYDEVWIRG